MVTIFNSDLDLWDFVEKKTRRKVSQETRSYFEKTRRLVSEILQEQSEEALDTLLAELEGVFSIIDGVVGIRAHEPKRDDLRIDEEIELAGKVDERRRILTHLAVRRASQSQWVRLFRQSYLPDGLLDFDEIHAWVKERLASEGPMRPLATKAPPPGLDTMRQKTVGKPRFPIHDLENPDSLATEKVWIGLRYSTPAADGRIRERVETVIPPGGVLEQLRNLAAYLASELHWREEEATTFVLTGGLPLLPKMSCDVLVSSFPEVPKYLKILVDPNTSPQELSKMYQSWRERLGKPRSARPLGARKQALIWFVLANGDCSWNERARRWRTNPNTRDFKDYADGDTMRKAYHKAKASILPG